MDWVQPMISSSQTEEIGALRSDASPVPTLAGCLHAGYWPVYPVDFALTAKGAGWSDPICKWKSSNKGRRGSRDGETVGQFRGAAA